MVLGEGARKVGEACWSHAQCARSQHNTHCHALVCVCDYGFNNNNGRCSRNMWDDLGLAPWELILVSLFFTLLFFAVFVGCMYFLISKIIRFRKTRPSEDFLPVSRSFKEKGCERGQAMSDVVVSAKNAAKAYETKLVDEGTTAVESHLVEEEENDNSSSATLVFEPVRFITPLEYKYSDSGISDTWQSSRRSSTSQSSGFQSRSYTNRQSRFSRAWSQSAATSCDDSDSWFQPNRNHSRRFGPNSPAGTTRLPLLLRAATFSESDESP